MKEYILIALLCMATHDMMAVDAKCVITGTVVERRTGEPLAGVEVSIGVNGIHATTDAQGTFCFATADTGRQLLVVVVQEWGRFQRYVHVRDDSLTTLVIRVWPGSEWAFQGVLAHYTLDGNGIDDGPNGWDGVVHGVVPVADRHGFNGQAMHFDGTTQRIEVAHRERLNQLPLSISFWVKADTGGAATTHWLGKYRGADEDGWAVGRKATWLVAHFTKFVPHDYSSSWTWFQPDGAWHHVVVSMDTLHVILYIDGLLEQRTSNFKGHTRYAINTEPLSIGLVRGAYVNDGLSGSLDDLAIFDHVLSDEEIEELRKK